MKSQLLEHSLQVLKLIAASRNPLQLQELARQSNLSPSTLGRIVADLCESGLVEKPTYHQVVVSSGLLALGDQARRNSIFMQKIAPFLRVKFQELQISGALGTVWEEQLVMLFHYRAPQDMRWPDNLPLWRSHIALVVLAQSSEREPAMETLRRSMSAEVPNSTRESELLRIAEHWTEAKTKGYLLLQEFERRWSVTCPLKIWNKDYAITMGGTPNSPWGPERMLIECSKLCNLIASEF